MTCMLTGRAESSDSVRVASNEPSKRRQHQKTRSGCLTCKTRRVKCDETRPTCLRCSKFGIRCEGYAHLEESQRPSTGVKFLLPNTHIKRSHGGLYRGPSLLQFETEEDARYFEVFSRDTAYEIFPNVEMGKMRLMLLQACDSTASIRHAIIALGALDKTSQASTYHGHTSDITYASSSGHHYQHAMKEYSRAIKYAQGTGLKDFRTALFTSLVILSFEGWIGNHDAAVQQIKIGAGLLKGLREQSKDRNLSGLAAPTPGDDEKILTHVFTRLSVQSRSPPPKDRPPPSTSPAPLPPLQIAIPEALARMPKSFSTLAEAGRFYSAIVRFAVAFVSQALPRIAQASSLTGAYSTDGDTPADIAIPIEIVKVQALLTESLHRWMDAFAPFKTSREFKTLGEKKAAITLELQMKATYMGTIKSLAQDELVFDEYYSTYSDIVTLSTALLECSPASKIPKFSFDSSVIIPLWFTGHKCRDPVIRRKAISLLLQYPRREGVWDSVFAGLVIDVLRSFEEEFMVRGVIPGWARIGRTSFEVNLETRTVEVKCQQRLSPTEKTVTRQRTVDYYVHTGVSLEQVGAVISH